MLGTKGLASRPSCPKCPTRFRVPTVRRVPSDRRDVPTMAHAGGADSFSLCRRVSPSPRPGKNPPAHAVWFRPLRPSRALNFQTSEASNAQSRCGILARRHRCDNILFLQQPDNNHAGTRMNLHFCVQIRNAGLHFTHQKVDISYIRNLVLCLINRYINCRRGSFCCLRLHRP